MTVTTEADLQSPPDEAMQTKPVAPTPEQLAEWMANIKPGTTNIMDVIAELIASALFWQHARDAQEIAELRVQLAEVKAERDRLAELARMLIDPYDKSLTEVHYLRSIMKRCGILDPSGQPVGTWHERAALSTARTDEKG